MADPGSPGAGPDPESGRRRGLEEERAEDLERSRTRREEVAAAREHTRSTGVTRDRHGPVVEHTGFRLSWGGIFAGLVVAIVAHIILSLAGVAIGFATWDPGDPVRDLGIGAGIWMVASILIALFLGGLITGRLAGVLTEGDSALHGVVLWGLSTLVMLWLVASGVGMIVGGAFAVIERTVTATAQVGAAAAQPVMEELGIDDVGLADAEAEITAILRETRDPTLQPEAIEAEAEDVQERAVAEDVSNEQLARDIVGTIRERGGRVDREAIVNVISGRTEMSRPEAERVATRVETVAADIRGEVEDIDLEEIGEDATDAIAQGAMWALLGLMLSLGAAVGGSVITGRS